MSNIPDITSALQSIQLGSLQVPIFGVAIAIAIGIGVFFIWIRTNSSYSILTLLWKIVHGPSEKPEDLIGKYFESESSLIKFRFVSGINARTKKQAEELINWSIDKNESLQDIAKIKNYFDLENLCLIKEKIPTKRKSIFIALIFLLSLLMTIPTTQGIRSEKALLQFKESGKFFFATTESATTLNGELIIKKENCSTPPYSFDFTKDEKISMCNIFTNNGQKSFIFESIKAQRILLTACLFALIFLAFILMKEIRGIIKVNEIRRRIENIR